MMKPVIKGLGRQIIASMVAATLVAMFVALAGIWLFYGLISTFAPNLLGSMSNVLPGRLEWLMMAFLCLIGLAVAVAIAVRLARRIVAPLLSVASSARQIAAGDLTARATPGDRSLGEAAMLVEDFNAMAGRLQGMSDEVAGWNALIAHELRTPVTILKGRLQGLADGVFKPDQALFLNLLAQVDGLARLVEDLRTVSLFESGQLDFRFVEVDLAPEIEGVIRLTEPQLQNAGFPVFASLDSGLCYADPGRVRQALLAMLENVRRHADAGPVHVGLELSRDGVKLSVGDSGPGLDDDFAAHAFKPFRRQAKAGDVASGSGLGLAVVLAIAEAHGGKAFYDRAEGGVFCVTFPRDRRAPSSKS